LLFIKYLLNLYTNNKGKIMTALEREIRERRIKQCDLAKKLGITPAAVCLQMQTGVRTVSAANNYARAIGCKPHELMDF
jgi:predicted XRE-type DNA-binding protein